MYVYKWMYLMSDCDVITGGGGGGPDITHIISVLCAFNYMYVCGKVKL